YLPTSYLPTNVAIRYSPKSRLLDVFVNDKRILRVMDFHLENYKILKDGKAKVGFISISRIPYGYPGPDDRTLLNSWAFGNNLNSPGIFSGAYSELMTFKTAGQNL